MVAVPNRGRRLTLDYGVPHSCGLIVALLVLVWHVALRTSRM